MVVQKVERRNQSLEVLIGLSDTWQVGVAEEKEEMRMRICAWSQGVRGRGEGI
jgi:hypothetical protein